jgi:L-fuculose-phosphate aldolase
VDENSVMARTRFGDGREGPQAAWETLEHLQFDVSPSVTARSSEAEARRAEIIEVGRKLWRRQCVDGNGGNISVSLGSRYFLCTPTMVSKGDLTPDDLCLSDLEGNVLAGDRMRTSEILLHLAI